MLSVGIIGLPNVGKSSLFNALTRGNAQVSNYPFTTVDSNVGMVAVPDPRLERLQALLKPISTTPCSICFTDIAGLVKGASKGEGLGNQFLGHIRQVDALAHLLRCFDDSQTTHVFASVDPVRDAEVVTTELLLADLEVLTRAIEKRQRDWRTHPREHQAEEERFSRYRTSLEQGIPLRQLPLEPDERDELKQLGMLTSKPVLYVANVADETSGDTSCHLPELAGSDCLAAPVLELSVALESELAQLEQQERTELMADLGLTDSGLERLVQAAFDLLGLITFFTVVKNKLHAWEIPKGTLAPQAAGKVHSDMERGFIRAKVVSFDELDAHGSLTQLHAKGLERTVGKDYEIADGDVVEFLFSG